MIKVLSHRKNPELLEAVVKLDKICYGYAVKSDFVSDFAVKWCNIK